MSEIYCNVTEERIDPSKMFERVLHSEHGAQAHFFGMVRNHNLGKKVRAVDYDAFGPLAEQTFYEIAREAKNKWGERLNIFVQHRIGHLEIGDISIAIVIGSPHRDEAFRACRYVIEQIKVRSPIWKKENYEDGESEWVRGHALCSHGHHHEDDDGHDHHRGHTSGREIHSHGTRQSEPTV